tara:strand:- start:75 stop:488 length:414 start_codon:yes stop_codon:yes gene_type:complete
MKISKTSQITLDKAAVYLSALCAIQCLILPLSMIFLPSVTLISFSEELFHTLLLFLVIPISAFAMLTGCKKHKNYNIIFYGALGLAILLVSAIYGHDLFGESGEIASTLVGASVLSFGHIKNQKLCKECCHQPSSGE